MAPKLIAIVFVSLLLLNSLTGYCQQNIQVQEHYLQKSKNQKTAGWVLLTTGFMAAVTGLAITGNNTLDNIINAEDKDTGGEAVTIAGITVMAGSIPFFVMASKNRKNAYSLSASHQQWPSTHKQNLSYHRIPVIHLKFCF